jgi:hypothetical protein
MPPRQPRPRTAWSSGRQAFPLSRDYREGVAHPRRHLGTSAPTQQNQGWRPMHHLLGCTSGRSAGFLRMPCQLGAVKQLRTRVRFPACSSRFACQNHRASRRTSSIRRADRIELASSWGNRQTSAPSDGYEEKLSRLRRTVVLAVVLLENAMQSVGEGVGALQALTRNVLQIGWFPPREAIGSHPGGRRFESG